MAPATLQVLAIGAAPTLAADSVGFRLMVRQLHLRADVDVSVIWLEPGPEQDRWKTYARAQLVYDDLRTWWPAAVLGRGSSLAAGKLRGLRARIELRRLGVPHVVLLQGGGGSHVLRNVPRGALRIATWHRGSPHPGADLPPFDLVIAEAGAEPPPFAGQTLTVPPPFDGRAARARAMASNEVASPQPDRPKAARVLGLAPTDGDGSISEALPLGDSQASAEDPSRELTPASADLIVVLGPIDACDPHLMEATMAGTPVVDTHGYLAGEPVASLFLEPPEPSPSVGDLGWFVPEPTSRRHERIAAAADTIDVKAAMDHVHDALLALRRRS